MALTLLRPLPQPPPPTPSLPSSPPLALALARSISPSFRPLTERSRCAQTYVHAHLPAINEGTNRQKRAALAAHATDFLAECCAIFIYAYLQTNFVHQLLCLRPNSRRQSTSSPLHPPPLHLPPAERGSTSMARARSMSPWAKNSSVTATDHSAATAAGFTTLEMSAHLSSSCGTELQSSCSLRTLFCPRK